MTTSQITGLRELTGKLGAMKAAFDGPPVQKLALQAARLIAQQAKRNARVGPTGAVVRNITAFAGRKAFKAGAMAVAKVKWRGTGAVLEEWGRADDAGVPKGKAMRISLSKLGASAASFNRAGNVGARGKRGAVVGGFGYAFAKHIKGMTGTRFFENAVEQKMPEAARILSDGAKDLIAEAIR